MPKKTYQYAADYVDLIFKGIPIIGFADGTFVDIEREEDTFTKKVGSLGDVTRTRNLNRSGKITITLMAAAPVNSQLQQLASQDEQDGSAMGAFTMKDRSTNTEANASDCWVMKAPKIDRAKESGTVIWVFEASNIQIVHGAGQI